MKYLSAYDSNKDILTLTDIETEVSEKYSKDEFLDEFYCDDYSEIGADMPELIFGVYFPNDEVNIKTHVLTKSQALNYGSRLNSIGQDKSY